VFQLTTRLALGASLLMCVGSALWFRRRQNQAHSMGGRISNPKVLWLFYAIWFWLFECAVLAFEPSLPVGYRVIFGMHAASMWLRGLVEMFMLYVTKNWRPPIGIAHDVWCVISVVGLVAYFNKDLLGPSVWGPWALALTVMLVFSLVVEVLYAALFFRAVQGKTTGDKGVWFASEDEERFKRLNRITAAFNAPQVVFQVMVLWLGFVVQ
jgi:hypothetical protein